jgi:hypothetical protein
MDQASDLFLTRIDEISACLRMLSLHEGIPYRQDPPTDASSCLDNRHSRPVFQELDSGG